MTNLIMSIVAALILTENSGPESVGKCGGVGVLQITPIMHREYVRMGGNLPADSRYNPLLSKQIAFKVISERLARAGYTEPSEDCVKYAAHLWNPGASDYYQRVKGNIFHE